MEGDNVLGRIPPALLDALLQGKGRRAELERLRADLLATKSAAEQARLAAEENARARQTAEQRARHEAEERATWEQLATEAEQERQALRARLDAAQRLAEAAPVNFQEVIEQGEAAAQKPRRGRDPADCRPDPK